MRIVVGIVAVVLLSSCVHTVSVRDYNNYSFVLVQKGLYKEAEFYLLKAEKTEPENYRIKNNLAIVYEALGDKEKAKRYYEQSLLLHKTTNIQKNYENFKTDTNR